MNADDNHMRRTASVRPLSSLIGVFLLMAAPGHAQPEVFVTRPYEVLGPVAEDPLRYFKMTAPPGRAFCIERQVAWSNGFWFPLGEEGCSPYTYGVKDPTASIGFYHSFAMIDPPYLWDDFKDRCVATSEITQAKYRELGAAVSGLRSRSCVTETRDSRYEHMVVAVRGEIQLGLYYYFYARGPLKDRAALDASLLQFLAGVEITPVGQGADER